MSVDKVSYKYLQTKFSWEGESSRKKAGNNSAKAFFYIYLNDKYSNRIVIINIAARVDWTKLNNQWT